MEEKDNKEKLTYEQLNDYCNQLYLQNNELSRRLRAITNIQNKLPYLFEVVKNAKMFNKEFVSSCIEEITIIMTPPTEDSNEDTKEEK